MAKKTSGSSHGGARPGAGRPRGTGRYGEPTQPMRIPESLVIRRSRRLQRFHHAASPDFSPVSSASGL